MVRERVGRERGEGRDMREGKWGRGEGEMRDVERERKGCESRTRGEKRERGEER